MESERQAASEEGRVESKCLLKIFSFFKKKTIYFNLSVMCRSLYFPHKCEYSCGPKDGVGSPVAGIIGSCEPPDVSMGAQNGTLVLWKTSKCA